LASLRSAVVALVIGLGIAKCSYDRKVVANASAKQEASNAKADRKADAGAAVTAAPMTPASLRNPNSSKRAQAMLRLTLTAALLALAACAQQQAARAGHREPPACT
jgi:hypothetical protein